MSVPDLAALHEIPDAYKPRALTDSCGGVLAGTWLGPRPVAKLAHDAGFRDDELFRAVAICGAESWLYTKAHHDNCNANGVVQSRDVGLWEISIPASEIGTEVEMSLYDPATNAAAAFKLWQARGWEPWVSFTSNSYLHDTYRLWAYFGVANRWSEIEGAAAAAAGITSKVALPAISIPTARKLWPTTPLG